MDPHLQELLDKARAGEPDSFDALIQALQDGSSPAAVLIEGAGSGDEVFQRAIIGAARGRGEPDLLEALGALAYDPVMGVRQCLAAALETNPAWPLEAAVERLLEDEDQFVRLAAVRAAQVRGTCQATLLYQLSQDGSWMVRKAIAQGMSQADGRAVVPALLASLAEDADPDVQQACAATLEKHLANLQGYPADLPRPRFGVIQEAAKRLGGFKTEYHPVLTAWLQERARADVDLDKLQTFGTVLTLEAEAGKVPRAYRVDAACEAVRAVLNGKPPRAAVLLGEPGSGKTSVVNGLVHRLRNDPAGPWHVLRMTPTEFMVGTHYTGDWETRTNNLVSAIRAPQRVLLYVPNLQELSAMGAWSKSEASVASALAPHIERGDIAILGESTPEAFRSGLGAVSWLRRLFHTIEVRETPPAETRAILNEVVRNEAEVEVPEAVLDRLGELADYFLAGTAQPGRTVGLLRRVLSSTKGRIEPLTPRDVLATLSTSTGIPIDFLDDNVPMDAAKIRAFFEERVMGQTEAVDAVVDLVTLIKAGLTDPGKPFGILFFIGPTGVGKTELARTLAELLFGDSGRLVRLDMSEFATYDAYERLLGVGVKPGLLTGPVRDRPFSVVLLDEIEKANPTIYDLCLQIFDAGRLTDNQGRTADFRRTIIILTSNIGSNVPQQAGVGFQTTLPTPPSRDATLRELSRWFRPEFLNRLDRIITFQPLGAETAEKIARREVARVLERNGITRRRLGVDVEPAVLALLLREGYSPAFGARPLKRTVERLLLLPMARAMAAGNVPAGAVLRLVARGGRVDAEVVPPEPEPGSKGAGKDEASAPVLPHARSLRQKIETLLVKVNELREQAGPLSARKSDLIAQSAQPGFWDDRDAARELLDEIYRLDGILAELDNLDKAVRGQEDYLSRPRLLERDLMKIEERLDVLINQSQHVSFLVTCREARDLGDALVTLTLVTKQGDGLDAVEKLARMYMSLGRRHALEVEVLNDCQGGQPHQDAIVLQLSGAGAFALLAGENGLHQVARVRNEKKGARRRSVDRDMVRVDVIPVPRGETPLCRDDVRIETRALNDAQGRLLAKPKFEVQLLHVPTMISVRAWTDGTKAQAGERLMVLLRAQVEAARTSLECPAAQPLLVRRYSLGPAPLVRDLRTGRSTGRLDQVLDGHLEAFLVMPKEAE